MFILLSKTEIIIFATLNLLSANPFNLDQSKILPIGTGLIWLLLAELKVCVLYTRKNICLPAFFHRKMKQPLSGILGLRKSCLQELPLTSHIHTLSTAWIYNRLLYEENTLL